MSGTAPITRNELADLIEEVVGSFYNDGTSTALHALEMVASGLRTPCACGFGGFHDDANEQCERYGE